jgi:hypothetical protein
MARPKRAAPKGAALPPSTSLKGPKMAKWKAPEDAGPGVSVGGAFFPVVDGFVETPNEGDYTFALLPFGYEPVGDAVEPVPTPAPAADAAPVSEPDPAQ